MICFFFSVKPKIEPAKIKKQIMKQKKEKEENLKEKVEEKKKKEEAKKKGKPKQQDYLRNFLPDIWRSPEISSLFRKKKTRKQKMQRNIKTAACFFKTDNLQEKMKSLTAVGKENNEKKTTSLWSNFEQDYYNVSKKKNMPYKLFFWNS